MPGCFILRLFEFADKSKLKRSVYIAINTIRKKIIPGGRYKNIFKDPCMQFEVCFKRSKFIITEGAIVERLKKEYKAGLDAYVNHAGLIYDSPERWILA